MTLRLHDVQAMARSTCFDDPLAAFPRDADEANWCWLQTLSVPRSARRTLTARVPWLQVEQRVYYICDDVGDASTAMLRRQCRCDRGALNATAALAFGGRKTSTHSSSILRGPPQGDRSEPWQRRHRTTRCVIPPLSSLPGRNAVSFEPGIGARSDGARSARFV